MATIVLALEFYKEEYVMKIEDKKKLKNFLLVMMFGIVTIIALLKSSYAFYGTSKELKIINSVVGNFSGKGDTTPLEKNTDINLLFYIEDVVNDNNYFVSYQTPIEQKGYEIDIKKSNCIPSSNEASYGENSIDSETGEVTINITEENPKQIVCRIYYTFNPSLYKPLTGDVTIIPIIESDEGIVVTIKDGKKYVIGSEPPLTTHDYNGYVCLNKTNETTLDFQNKEFTVSTNGKNTCYAYFNKKGVA